MLTTPLLHPAMLHALAGAGHGARVLVADAHYPVSTTVGPHAAVVHLNLVLGVVDAVTVIDAILATVSVEEAVVMTPQRQGPHARDGEPAVWSRYRESLRAAGSDVELTGVERMAFYEEVRGPDTALVVATAELETYANLLLRIGVVATGAPSTGAPSSGGQ